MRPSKFKKIADGFHQGFVWGCIGLTVLLIGHLGYRGYHYAVYQRPLLRELNANYEAALLKEGERLKNESNENISS